MKQILTEIQNGQFAKEWEREVLRLETMIRELRVQNEILTQEKVNYFILFYLS